MKQNRFKQLIALVLSFSIFASSTLTAGGVDALLNEAMVHIERPTTIKETDANGKVVVTNFYSGGVTVKFKNDTPPPIFAFSAPSIEAGCNGINIKGMFMALLGLDQLGAMLKNAGASAAWGVAIGLIYSLPGVASAFKMINQWAKDLQKLLANACQSGINLGMYLGKKFGLNRLDLEKKIMNKMPDWAKCSQEGENCIIAALGLGEYFDEDGIFNYGGSDGEVPDKDKVDALSRLFRGVFESDYSMGGKVVYSLIKQKRSGLANNVISNISGLPTSFEGSKVPFVHSKFSLGLGSGISSSGGLRNVGIDAIANQAPSESEKIKAKLALWGYILSYNFMGDVILSDTESFLNTALKDYIKADTDNAKKKAAEEFEHITSMAPVPSLSGPGATIPTSTSAQRLVNFILYGKNVSTLNSPIFEVLKEAEEKEGSKAAFTVILSSDIEKGKGLIDVSSYSGIKKASFCQVKKLIWGDDKLPSDCKGGNLQVPALIGDIHYFVKVIKNSPVSAKFKLEDILIQYNTQMAAIGLLNSIYGNLDMMGGFHKSLITQNSSGTNYQASNVKGETPDYAKTAAEAQMKLMQRISDVVEKAKDIIKKEDSGDIVSYKEVIELFKAQEKTNRERGVKNIVQ
jgi:hypothetical protein